MSLSNKTMSAKGLLDGIDDQVETDKPVVPILYQDDFLVAVDKPSGLFVHRSFMDRDEQYFALQLVRDQLGQYVYPVHRLDRPTSGVLLFALTEDIARAMNDLFASRAMKKSYLAMVRGYLLGEGRIDHPLKAKLDKFGDKYVDPNKPAKSAVSDYQSLATASLPIPLGKYATVRYSLIKVQPQSGRRHQIRRHLAHIRYPIIGDINYGDNKQNPFFHQHFGFKRLMLHAIQLSFRHPVTNAEVTIDAPLPIAWRDVFAELDWQTLFDQQGKLIAN